MTGLEPIFLKAAEGFAGLVIKTGWEMANVRLDEPVRQLIFRASRQYIENYRNRHGILKVLGMRQPIPLESVYTTVQFLDNAAVQSFASIADLEQAYRLSNQRGLRWRQAEKHGGLEIANQTPYLMVLGGPGTGKSTFLRKIGLEALKGRQKVGFQHLCLPVLLELKEFRSSEIDIKAAIGREFEICGFPEYQRFTEQALAQGQLLVLLDGLDEVPADRLNELVSRIQNFVDRYSKNRFIASCRVAAYRYNLRRFTDVAIADFSDEQIQSFITSWFQQQPEQGKACWEKLASQDYAAARELAHTPLLLTLVCLLYQRAGQFPTNRATLYYRALWVLLEEWAGEKGIPQELLYKGLDTRRKELMLAEIAHDALQSDQLFLSKREIARQIERILQDMLPEEPFIDGVAVLRSMEIQHGILVEQADEIYSFSHLTIQEFLTAQYIVDDEEKIEQLVTDRLTETRWHEVFLLLAGLKRADKLLLRIERQLPTLVQHPRVLSLLQWADQITTGSSGNYLPAAKRAAVLYFALAHNHPLIEASPGSPVGLTRTIATARAIALELLLDVTRRIALDLARSRTIATDLARLITHDADLARRLEQARIFHKNVDFKRLIAHLEALAVRLAQPQPTKTEVEEMRRQVQDHWQTCLQFPLRFPLENSESLELADYLEATFLLIQAKQAAVQVSQKTWSEIEQRLLKLNGF